MMIGRMYHSVAHVDMLTVVAAAVDNAAVVAVVAVVVAVVAVAVAVVVAVVVAVALLDDYIEIQLVKKS